MMIHKEHVVFLPLRLYFLFLLVKLKHTVTPGILLIFIFWPLHPFFKAFCWKLD